MEAQSLPAEAEIAHPQGVELSQAPAASSRLVGWLFGLTGVALFGLMAVLGILMRLSQSGAITLSASWFYRFMTLHAAGMLVGALLAMMGGIWFVSASFLRLSLPRMLWSYGTIVAGTVAVLISVLVGGFAAAWTFLTPLPFHSMGAWPSWATLVFLIGMALVGIGFMVFCIDAITCTTATYGGLQRALGISYLRGRDDSPPPPAALATLVVGLEGLLASIAGTTVLMALITRVFDSGETINPLWGKNLTYFFGHSIANLIIYLAAGMIYVLVPRYAGRPWKTSKPLVWGWLGTLIFVTFAYSHHLYMDFVQPQFAGVVSMVASAGAPIPVAVVTIYTGMMLIWGARYRWTLASTLLYAGFAGWAIGGVGAVIDALIPVNLFFHNTLWVPAHFHTYLLMGIGLWMFGLVAHLLERAAGRPSARWAAFTVPALLLTGGYGLMAMWFMSGALGVGRRMAVHPAGTRGYSLAASIFAIIFFAGFLVMLVEFARLWKTARNRPAAEREREPAPVAHLTPAPQAQQGPLLRTPYQLMLGVAAATTALIAFMPGVVSASEGDPALHHLDHAAQFFFGGMLAITITSTAAYTPKLRIGASGVALGLAIVVPAAMLLLMAPGVYTGLSSNEIGHFGYHSGVVVLGVVTALACVRLGRVPGWLTFMLSVAMAVMYAAGVGGV